MDILQRKELRNSTISHLYLPEGSRVFSNAQMTPRLIRRHCRLDAGGERLLEQAMTRQGLSARAYDRILKVSRTIADLEASADVLPKHVSEAVGYRSLDRSYWA